MLVVCLARERMLIFTLKSTRSLLTIVFLHRGASCVLLLSSITRIDRAIMQRQRHVRCKVMQRFVARGEKGQREKAACICIRTAERNLGIVKQCRG